MAREHVLEGCEVHALPRHQLMTDCVVSMPACNVKVPEFSVEKGAYAEEKKKNKTKHTAAATTTTTTAKKNTINTMITTII